MWQADPQVWGYHSPILFPYCGKLTGFRCEAKGQVWEKASPHGFVRTMEHRLLRMSSTEIILEVTDTPETYANWPYHFRLISSFILNGDTVCHRLTVENTDSDLLRFGIGYHPGFSVPFDSNHVAEDYELRFDAPQSPLCVDCLPLGLVNGKWDYTLGCNISTIPLTPELFANDSHCMAGLTAKTIGIYERGTGRGVKVEIGNFPYTLLWSKPDWPLRFVCIEPWMSLPGHENGSCDWNRKPAAAALEPGQSWHVDMNVHFIR